MAKIPSKKNWELVRDCCRQMRNKILQVSTRNEEPPPGNRLSIGRYDFRISIMSTHHIYIIQYVSQPYELHTFRKLQVFQGVIVFKGLLNSCIYHTLRSPVTGEEYHAIKFSSDLKCINAAYEHRHQRIHNGYAVYREREGGVRWVDFLARHTHFLGLSSNEGHFLLNVL
jgi:hypothetical protein